MSKAHDKGLQLAIEECRRLGCKSCEEAIAARMSTAPAGKMAPHTVLRWQERVRRDPSLIPRDMIPILRANGVQI